MPLCFAGLMCHAPIVIPEVAGPRADLCRRTTRSMREMAERAVRSSPDRLVLVSPHSPRHPERFAAWPGVHRGDLGDFGSPQLRVELPDAPEVARALGLPKIGSPEIKPLPLAGWMDHGAMVPLHFLWEAGWRGPTAILALPWTKQPRSEALGRALAALSGRTAVIASGDMSHRLMKGAPAGFHPRAKDFDRAFVQALRKGDWAAAVGSAWRDEAAEDVVDSTRVAMGAAESPLCDEVLCYEGPWGVGYTEAVLYDPAPPLYAVARQAVHAQVLGRSYHPPEGGPDCSGTFVTLRVDSRLRGCIGMVQPPRKGSYAQVAGNARSAATRDHRFEPIQQEELPRLSVEISVLGPGEPISGPSMLDPSVYGVIVRSGSRYGVMLPDVEGIDTVEQQIRLTCSKVGIDPSAPLALERFKVMKEVQP
jgi:MEMO1 family protein